MRQGAYDALLVTHPHSDHFEDVVPMLLDDPSLKAVTQFDLVTYLKSHGVEEKQLIGMNTGGTVAIKDVRITMVPAVHTSSVTVGSAQRALGVAIGYVVRFANGFTIYNTGDTAATMDMKIVHDLYKPAPRHPAHRRLLHHGRGAGRLRAEFAQAASSPSAAIGARGTACRPAHPKHLEKELAQYQLPTQLIKLKPGETLT